MRTKAAGQVSMPDRDITVQEQVDSLLLRLQPTRVADERRRAVLRYVQAVVEKQVPTCKIFPVGSFPLKTYLPCADVDIVMFTAPRAASNAPRRDPRCESRSAAEAESIGSRSGLEQATDVDEVPAALGELSSPAPVPALVAVNQALCAVAAQTSRGRRSGASGDETARIEIRNVSFINARTPIVTMVVGNVVVDLTENQGGSVAASALLEEADRWIGRDHLFKRSLVLLKAWALCETQRIVGQRILGAREGGLTSYGLSVMVLHLFSLSSSADTLTHPLDVLVLFFQFYSEFDWGRHCLTLDGPVVFDDIRNVGGARSSAAVSSQLWPLVDMVQAHLSPDRANKSTHPRGRRYPHETVSKSDVAGGSPRTQPAYWGASEAPATAHFPVRHCNIQDPMNALNNLGHSVSRRSLKSLELVLKEGRRLLEDLRVSCPPSSPSFPSPSPLPPPSPPPSTSRSDPALAFPSRLDNPLQRREAGRLKARTGDALRDIGGVGSGKVSGNPSRNSGSGEMGSEAPESPQLTPPPGQRIGGSLPPSGAVSQTFVPHVQYLGLPNGQSAHTGAVFAPPQPMVMAAAPQGTHHVVPLAPQLAGGYRYQYILHPNVVGQPSVGPGVGHHPPALLLPAGMQLHPNLLRQWNMPRIAFVGVQSELPQQLQYQHQQQHQYQQQQHYQPYQQQHIFEGTNSPQLALGGYAVADERVNISVDEEQHAGQRPAPIAEEGRTRRNCSQSADPNKVEEARDGRKNFQGEKNCATGGGRKKRRDGGRGQPDDRSMRNLVLPLTLPAFIHSPPTASTASLSEFAEDGGSKDDQECQSACESMEETEAAGGRAGRGVDGSRDRVDAAASKPTPKRGGNSGGKRSRRVAAAAVGGRTANDGFASGNLWANHRFLREFFPYCCQVYASGDGFREDLLDHPCQHWSKLQERGAPKQHRPDSRDILEGASEDIWTALETVGRMMREGATPVEEGVGVEAVPPVVASLATETRAGEKSGEGTRRNVVDNGTGKSDGAAGDGCRARETEQRATQSIRTAEADACDAKGLVQPEFEVVRAVGACKGGHESRTASEPDDDNGYTTSEDQGEKADTPSGSSTSNVNAALSTPPRQSPLPQVNDRAPPSSPEAKKPPTRGCQALSASTQTDLVSPELPTLMVDTGTQCAAPPGVDLGTQSAKIPTLHTRPHGVLPNRLISKGTQCAESRSVQTVCRGVQCSLLVSIPGEGARALPAQAAFAQDSTEEESPQIVDAQSEDAPAEGDSTEEALAEDVPEEEDPGEGWKVATEESDGWGGGWRQEFRQANASNGERNSVSVRCSGSVETQLRHVSPVERMEPASLACADGSEAAAAKEAVANAKPKKKRKKGKSAGVTGRTNGNLYAADLSEAVMMRSRILPRPDKQAWIWIAALLGVLSLVLAGTWGGARVSGGPRKGVGVVGVGYEPPSPSTVQPSTKEDRSQPPMWVVVGGSLTLGDVVVPPRAFGRADSAERFQWYKDGKPILGQNRSFLTLTAVGWEDEGMYTCLVGGSNKALWREVAVRVSEPPFVESQLQTQRLGRGEMLVILATARGTPPPEYQWRRNGVPIPGANRPMLVKHSVTEADVGTYTCDVFNVAGSAQWEEMAVILREGNGYTIDPKRGSGARHTRWR